MRSRDTLTPDSITTSHLASLTRAREVAAARDESNTYIHLIQQRIHVLSLQHSRYASLDNA